MAKAKVTSTSAGRAASSTLRSSSTGTRSKSAADSALSQRKAPAKTASPKGASAASSALQIDAHPNHQNRLRVALYHNAHRRNRRSNVGSALARLGGLTGINRHRGHRGVLFFPANLRKRSLEGSGG